MDSIQRVFVSQTTSTNDLAKAYAKEHGGVRAVFTARAQSAGRGRMGHSFLSPVGGLYTSLLCQPTVPAACAVRLTVYAAAVAARVLEEMTGHTVDIKWVNDLYMNGKKIAGILTEGALSENGEHLSYAVVGIGINLAHTDFPEELSKLATTVEDASGVRLAPEEVERRLVDAFFAGEPTDAWVMEEYRRRSFLIGRRVTACRGEEHFPCRVLDVTDSGALRVLLEDGREEELFSGEVSVRKGT